MATGSPTPTRENLPPETAARLDAIWRRAYGAKTPEDLKRLYADWAKSYDEDHDAIGFDGHRLAAALMAKYVPFAEVAAVLDAGCGTGAAGTALHDVGFRNVTGADFSLEMLEQAERKDVYRQLVQADLGLPLDAFPNHHFDGVVSVGVFSYGQAPAHALDELLRVTKPGGTILFTMRTDFYESDAMGVASAVRRLEDAGAWQLVELTEPAQYLPKKDPDAMYRIWAYRVLENKIPDAPEDFADAVREAMSGDRRVRRLDHCHIWNSMASRLYNAYIECEDYYLPNAEEEILRDNAAEIVGAEPCIVELGCGSARKISHLFASRLDASGGATSEAASATNGDAIEYVPIDLSKGALEHTQRDVREAFGDRVRVDTRLGHFDEILPTLPVDRAKVIFFFGGSIGNIETLRETVEFLRSIRDRMNPDDRFVFGADLDKDESILKRAYEAGPKNLSFFLNMVRRINNELGANFDLTAFEQESTYDRGEDHEGVQDRCVNLKVVATEPQVVYISDLEIEVEMKVGDAIQVGTSRKFREEDIDRLVELAGLKKRRRWLDERGWFSMNEVVRDDSGR